jgi:hypothetical protein
LDFSWGSFLHIVFTVNLQQRKHDRSSVFAIASAHMPLVV